ncbi:MAG: Holliday junction branch migration protein RuvA [Gammaproteobacteria bacterium]|nr:Holliday junction branch migration protein RuvA [Gammaproteobacteria bacterium]
MIARISGILLHKQPDQIVVDVHGVAYDIEISFNSYCQLADEGQSVVLHTHFVIREDAQLLFGFAQLEERSLFRMLIKVNGVGPKLGLAILSGMDAQTFSQCIQNQDAATLVKIPGVGKKTAERLVLELRDKLALWQSDHGASNVATDISTGMLVGTAQSEAESALLTLGYKPVQATKAVAAALRTSPEGRSEDLIRLALKGMI